MLELFNEAAINFNGWCSERNRFDIPVTLDTPVAGPGSPLDSMAFLNFIMETEELLIARGYQVNLTTVEALEHWDTIGSILQHLKRLSHV